MALIKCKECGHDVSTEAKSCPNCGAKVKVEKKSIWRTDLGSLNRRQKLLLWIGVPLLLIFMMIRAGNAPISDGVNSTDMELISARVACERNLLKSLNDPDSAKLDSLDRWYAERRPDGTILVQPTGRAKNAFGAYMNGAWSCVVKREAGGNRLISLNQIRP